MAEYINTATLDDRFYATIWKHVFKETYYAVIYDKSKIRVTARNLQEVCKVGTTEEVADISDAVAAAAALVAELQFEERKPILTGWDLD